MSPYLTKQSNTFSRNSLGCLNYACTIAYCWRTIFFVTKEEFKVEILSISDCMTTKSMVFPIYITAPNLMKYHFSGSCLDSCSIMGAHKLKDANIYIDSPVAHQSQESLLDTLLKDLSHCQTLYLNSWCIQVIIYSTHHNLL